MHHGSPTAACSLVSRNRNDRGTRESEHMRQAHAQLYCSLRPIAAGGESVPRRKGSKLQTPTSSSLWAWLLIVAALLPSVCQATVIALDPTDPQVVHLLDLCRADEPCALHWYLTYPPIPATPWETASFAFLLSRFAMDVLLSPDGSLSTLPEWQDDPYLVTAASLDPLLAAALDAKQDQEHTALLRSARFCGGLPNRIFRLGEGCICAPESDCSDAMASLNAYETVTISISLLFAAVVIVVSSWVVIDQLSRTQRVADANEQQMKLISEVATGHAIVGRVNLRIPA